MKKLLMIATLLAALSYSGDLSAQNKTKQHKQSKVTATTKKIPADVNKQKKVVGAVVSDQIPVSKGSLLEKAIARESAKSGKKLTVRPAEAVPKKKMKVSKQK